MINVISLHVLSNEFSDSIVSMYLITSLFYYLFLPASQFMFMHIYIQAVDNPKVSEMKDVLEYHGFSCVAEEVKETLFHC